jgi:SAM-dependent methyltransferase
MSRQTHRSDPRVLNRRTLERDHRTLAKLLRPGMIVLDVGCGTGAIAVGIAIAVGSEGSVLGIDRDAEQVAAARQEHGGVPNLSFAEGDVLSMSFEGRFDIVTAARTLQWLSQPAEAVLRMKKAAKTGGRVVALDYNHDYNSWEPDPPQAFRRFYQALLDWRSANQWDNRMAEHLPDLFRAAGIVDVQVHIEDEAVQRGDPDFSDAAGIWTHVIETVGPQIVAAGFLGESERREAEEVSRNWVRDTLRRQTLSLSAIEGRTG